MLSVMVALALPSNCLVALFDRMKLNLRQVLSPAHCFRVREWQIQSESLSAWPQNRQEIRSGERTLTHSLNQRFLILTIV